MVEDVPNQSHILEVELFCQAEALGKCHVVGVQTRPFQHIGTTVAEAPSRRIREARGVEPMLDGALVRGQVAITDPIGESAKGICVGRVGIREAR